MLYSKFIVSNSDKMLTQIMFMDSSLAHNDKFVILFYMIASVYHCSYNRKLPGPPAFPMTGGTILYKRPNQQTYAMTSSSLLANDNRFTTMPIDGEQGIYENNLDGYTFSYPRKSWNCRACNHVLLNWFCTDETLPVLCRVFICSTACYMPTRCRYGPTV